MRGTPLPYFSGRDRPGNFLASPTRTGVVGRGLAVVGIKVQPWAGEGGASPDYTDLGKYVSSRYSNGYAAYIGYW